MKFLKEDDYYGRETRSAFDQGLNHLTREQKYKIYNQITKYIKNMRRNDLIYGDEWEDFGRICKWYGLDRVTLIDNIEYLNVDDIYAILHQFDSIEDIIELEDLDREFGYNTFKKDEELEYKDLVLDYQDWIVNGNDKTEKQYLSTILTDENLNVIIERLNNALDDKDYNSIKDIILDIDGKIKDVEVKETSNYFINEINKLEAKHKQAFDVDHEEVIDEAKKIKSEIDKSMVKLNKRLNPKNEALKEDIDPRTNDTDDLYAVWYPYVGKRIVNKETMLKILQEEINRVKQSNRYYIGDGLAYRNIQMMCENPDTGKYEPRIPNHSDRDFLDNLDWKD